MPAGQEDGRPAGEGDCHTARVYIAEGSDSAIVPMSLLNKDGKPLAETGEGRALIGVNPKSETRIYRKIGNVSHERVHEKDT